MKRRITKLCSLKSGKRSRSLWWKWFAVVRKVAGVVRLLLELWDSVKKRL